MEGQILENQIEEEIEVPQEPANSSIRDELEKAFAKSKSEPTEKFDKPKAIATKDKPRAEDGKFRSEDGKFVRAKPTERTPEEIAARAQEEKYAKTPKGTLEVAPRGYTNVIKAKWNEFPEDVKKELIRRENDIEAGFAKMDDDRVMGRQMKDIINPYMPVIQSMGYSAPHVVQSLLNSTYILKTGTPEQKLAHLQQIAVSYGVNPAELTTQNSQPSIDPTVAALQRDLAQLKGERQTELTMKQQQDMEGANSAIRAFAADTENHPHFETVRPYMAMLFRSGMVQDLQDAYEQAVYANPNIRSTLIESHYADNEAKQIAEKKAKAEQARKAGSSIKGGPGVAVPNSKAPGKSIRENLVAGFAAARGTI